MGNDKLVKRFYMNLKCVKMMPVLYKWLSRQPIIWVMNGAVMTTVDMLLFFECEQAISAVCVSLYVLFRIAKVHMVIYSSCIFNGNV